jgi:hypothetical protein
VARTSNSKPIVFKLNRGGTIKFFPGICSAGQIQNLKEEMEEVSVFKQYKVRDCGKEPRVHALFASNGGGYQYGNVKMGSNPLDPMPFITKSWGTASSVNIFHLRSEIDLRSEVNFIDLRSTL